MKLKLISILALILLTHSVASNASRPTIGLVLSGGGARGGAHIGVIEVLEQNQIPIDIIVGTSMGAVIGGLYASGVPIEIIKRDFSNLNWQDIFSFDVKREYLYYRRKHDNDIFLLKNFISYSNKQLHLPWGIITGQSLYEIFNGYIIGRPSVTSFNDLPIPYKAVSTDLITGYPVVLEKGDLALSMLASMAVPGILSPIQMGEYLLVDGGVSSNLPIQVAKAMGADILIVVDVSTPLSTRDEITDLRTVLGQLSNILSHNNVIESEKLLSKDDVLIVPDLKDISTADFEKFSLAIQPGKMAALEKINQLDQFVYPIPPRRYVQRDVAIQEVDVQHSTLLCDETLHDYIQLEEKVVSADEIKESVDYLYGLDVFERIYYGVDDGKLTIIPQTKYRDPIYLQGSVLIDSDFEADNTFSLVLGLTNPQMNRLLGEWRVVGILGNGLGVGAEIYQPLEPSLKWFVNPNVSIKRTPYPVFYDYDRWATYLYTESVVSVSLGRVFSNVARAYGFVQFSYNDFEEETGTLAQTDLNSKNSQWGGALEWDNVDNAYFPHHGIKGLVKYISNEHMLGSDFHFKQLIVQNLGAFSFGKHGFVLGGRYNRTLSGTIDFSSSFSLGGLFELTGLSNSELMGRNKGLVTGIYYYEMSRISIIPNRPAPLYLGCSVEWGKVWQDVNLSNNRGITSGSIFAGVDSLIGPIYLAFGVTDNNHKALHLMLRPPFG